MKGLDLLGLAHPNFPHKMVLNQVSTFKGPIAIGAFAWGVFGNRRTFIRRIVDYCELKNVRAVRIQAYWDDNKARPPLDERLVRIPFLKKVAEVTSELRKQYPRMRFYLSHTCEYYSKNKAAIQKRNEVIKEIDKRIVTVNTPINGVHIGAEVLERHGDIRMGHGQIVSMDGKDATDINVKKWLSNNANAEIKFFWIHSFNLRIKGKAPPPRPERTVRVTKQEMEWLRQYF